MSAKLYSQPNFKSSSSSSHSSVSPGSPVTAGIEISFDQQDKEPIPLQTAEGKIGDIKPPPTSPEIPLEEISGSSEWASGTAD